MIDIEARLAELEALGLEPRSRLVSGPQGPRVVLDGRPVLMLASNNYLGLADHPRVRQAAADAAMRWGAGTGSARAHAGTMTVHRRLEERLAEFTGRESALLFGAGFLAAAGVIAALARPGEVVFCDEGNQAPIAEGCRLSGAEVFIYDHLDVEHLAWGIRHAEGRGALIATEGLFANEGDVAPLEDLVELSERHRVRLLVDEGHALGTLGARGRGALAEAGLEGQADVVMGTLGASLGSYGAFVAGEGLITRYLRTAARPLISSSAPPPPTLAAALAALELLEERPELVARLQANAAALRRELQREGVDLHASPTHIVPVLLGDAALAGAVADAAFTEGVFVQVIAPPAVPALACRLRLTAMASHRPDELRWAARTVAQALHRALSAAQSPPASVPDEFEEYDLPLGAGAPFDFQEQQAVEDRDLDTPTRVFDLEATRQPMATGVFDFEADDSLAA